MLIARTFLTVAAAALVVAPAARAEDTTLGVVKGSSDTAKVTFPLPGDWKQLVGALAGTPAIGSFQQELTVADGTRCFIRLTVFGQIYRQAPIVRGEVLRVGTKHDWLRFVARGPSWFRTGETNGGSYGTQHVSTFTAARILRRNAKLAPGGTPVVRATASTFAPSCRRYLRTAGPKLVVDTVRNARLAPGKPQPGTQNGQFVSA